MTPDDIHSLLRCPFCQQPLLDPTTLRCGHSVCLNHVRNTQCPLTHSHSPITPLTNVEIIPAPPLPLSNNHPPRSDVTLNNIRALAVASEHARKRRRRDPSPDPDLGADADPNDLLAHLRAQSAIRRHTRPNQPLEHTYSTTFQKDVQAELTCKICFMLLYQPLTTPCQHTFCAKCLHRSLDHSTACPLCRQELPGYAYFQDHPYNCLILSIRACHLLPPR
ncbi:hypothetical protein HGRIS_010010 [Hohenbuehelia grisea]|uniref:RING-type domain-containing protein n=1 Tax=Hohenbuehelia grisea TaxID=104357 RepID=A0ABR3J388_9AGAR